MDRGFARLVCPPLAGPLQNLPAMVVTLIVLGAVTKLGITVALVLASRRRRRVASRP
jgi:hypothetical protein